MLGVTGAPVEHGTDGKDERESTAPQANDGDGGLRHTLANRPVDGEAYGRK